MYLLPPATKLGQGNSFRSVCQEFCWRGGGVSAPLHAEIHTPWEQTPLPLEQTPPRADNPLEQTPPRADNPLVQCMLGDMGNKRAVHILLECIFVKFSFFKFSRTEQESLWFPLNNLDSLAQSADSEGNCSNINLHTLLMLHERRHHAILIKWNKIK